MLRYIWRVGDDDINARAREDAVGLEHVAVGENDIVVGTGGQEAHVYVVAAVFAREVDGGGGDIDARAHRGDVCGGEE